MRYARDDPVRYPSRPRSAGSTRRTITAGKSGDIEAATTLAIAGSMFSLPAEQKSLPINHAQRGLISA